MKPIIFFATTLVALSLTGISVHADDSTHGATKDSIESKVLLAKDRKFMEAFGPVKFADAFGSREKGPHGTYGKFPAGFTTPNHTHSHGYSAVVLQGRMTNPFEGEKNPPVMTPGSFWSVAAGKAHTTACVSKEPCVFLMWGESKFDFVAHDH